METEIRKVILMANPSVKVEVYCFPRRRLIFRFGVGAGGHLLWLGEVRRSLPSLLTLACA